MDTSIRWSAAAKGDSKVEFTVRIQKARQAVWEFPANNESILK